MDGLAGLGGEQTLRAPVLGMGLAPDQSLLLQVLDQPRGLSLVAPAVPREITR